MPTIDIQGRALHFVDEGSGPAVLLGHSFLWDHRMWSHQIEHLSRSYRCVAPDLWGHGQSAELIDRSYDLGRLSDDHGALMDTLGISRFAVIGLSVGGMWGALLAHRRPHAISALVLMDTFLGPEPTDTRQLYFGMLDAIEKAGAIPPALIDRVVPIFLAPKTLMENPGLVARFRKDLASFTPDQISTIVTIGRAIFSREDQLQELRNLRVPSLVVVGEHDRPRPPQEARQMADLIPGAHMEVIREAGHICAQEQPAAVNDVLASFLDQALRSQ